jgi:hypothetical protein
MRFTMSRDGERRADVRITYRLTVEQMAAIAHAWELDRGEELPLTSRAAVEQAMREKLADVGRDGAYLVHEAYESEGEWDAGRVHDLALVLGSQGKT